MFFTFFKRNLKIKFFYQHVIFHTFIIQCLFTVSYWNFFKSYFFLPIPFSTLAVAFFSAFLTYCSWVPRIYFYKLRILLEKHNKTNKWIQWYFFTKNSWHKNLFAFLLLPFLWLINIFGPILYFAHDIILDAKNQFHRSSESTFKFQTLSMATQYRFFQLQKPVTRLNFIKANPKKWLFEFYGTCMVADSLEIDLKNVYKHGGPFLNTKILQADPDWILDGWYYHVAQAFSEPHDLLFLRIKNAEKLKTQIFRLRNIIPLKYALFSSLKFNDFPTILRYCNLTNITRLEIVHSSLNKNDLKFIKEFRKLNFFRLCLKNVETVDPKFTRHLLKCLQGIPNIKIYVDSMYDDNFFEEILVDWILRNGYIKSLFFTFKFDYGNDGWFEEMPPKFVTFASESVTSFESFNRHK